MKKMLFVYNPRSGKGQIRSQLSYLLENFGRYGYEVTVHPTQRAMDASVFVEARGKRYDIIVCSGGDGTLDEVVTGMQKSGCSCPLGYIPAGSTNDFANSLGIPRQMRQAGRAIMEGEPFLCDVGRLNEDYFVYVAAFGAFTEVSYKTSQEWKNMIGHMAYLLEGVKSLSALKSWPMSFTSDQCSGKGNFLYGMITNSNSVGGFKGITGRDVTLNDGIFEVTLIKDPENLIEWPAIINALLTREKNKFVITFKTSKVEFHSEEEIPWTRDGEYGGSHQNVVIENIPRALSIIVMEHSNELIEDIAEEEEDWEETGII